MSNLCHFDVELGRLADAEGSVADALRISDERNTPSCTLWQLGVRARLRLLQGRWSEAEQDAQTVLRSGDLPLGQLWPHLVLGLLVARRDAPPENPDLDQLWRLVRSFDNPPMIAAAAAAFAENAWITRRPDPRLDDPLITGLSTPEYSGRDAAQAALQRWAARLGSPTPGCSRSPCRRSRPNPSPPISPTSRRWRSGTPARPTTCWRRCRSSTGSTRGQSRRWCGTRLRGGRPCQPGRADVPSARRAGAACRRPEQRRHRGAPGDLAQDRRPSPRGPARRRPDLGHRSAAGPQPLGNLEAVTGAGHSHAGAAHPRRFRIDATVRLP